MIYLHKELAAVVWDKTAEDFRELLADVFANMYPGSTDDDLKNSPDDAKRFCIAVRKQSRLSRLADPIILGALSNDRKRPSTQKKFYRTLKDRKRRKAS